MTDQILYLSMLLGIGALYGLIFSFDDDENGHDNREKNFYNLRLTNLVS